MTIQVHVHVHVGGSGSICIQPLYAAGFAGVNEEKFSILQCTYTVHVHVHSTLTKTMKCQ